MIVNTRVLVKAFRNQTGLVAVNSAIRMMFGAKYPFAANRILRGGGRNEIPGVIAKKGVKFSVESFMPVRVFEGLSNSSGLRSESSDIEGIFQVGLVDKVLSTSDHGVCVERGRGWKRRGRGMGFNRKREVNGETRFEWGNQVGSVLGVRSDRRVGSGGRVQVSR